MKSIINLVITAMLLAPGNALPAGGGAAPVLDPALAARDEPVLLDRHFGFRPGGKRTRVGHLVGSRNADEEEELALVARHFGYRPGGKRTRVSHLVGSRDADEEEEPALAARHFGYRPGRNRTRIGTLVGSRNADEEEELALAARNDDDLLSPREPSSPERQAGHRSGGKRTRVGHLVGSRNANADEEEEEEVVDEILSRDLNHNEPRADSCSYGKVKDLGSPGGTRKKVEKRNTNADEEEEAADEILSRDLNHNEPRADSCSYGKVKDLGLPGGKRKKVEKRSGSSAGGSSSPPKDKGAAPVRDRPNHKMFKIMPWARANPPNNNPQVGKTRPNNPQVGKPRPPFDNKWTNPQVPEVTLPAPTSRKVWKPKATTLPPKVKVPRPPVVFWD